MKFGGAGFFPMAKIFCKKEIGSFYNFRKSEYSVYQTIKIE
ncbi:hypothetical protein LEP1GSC041_3626 [Leptospira noguchii str. 2006001870]|nr:hypothetical protein LEP1GSC041_3626 [Leptospira noguchii str. 2006001870]